MKVYVGNISKQMNDTQFTELVTPFGATKSTNIAKDRASGLSRGFGFVEYPNDDHARAAISGLNGKEVQGQVLKVSESQPKSGARPATAADLSR